MSVIASPAASLPIAGSPIQLTAPLYRLSVPQYQAMVRAGILTENDNVELLDGLLVTKMSKNPPHRVATRRTRRRLEDVLPDAWFADSQEPVVLSASEPEPDITVARSELSDDSTRNPEAGDVALVVEVADSTLSHDCTVKRILYAEALTPIYWIVNLVDSQLEVYSDPTGPGPQPDYANRNTFGPNDDVPVVLDGQEVARIAVRDLLP
jgi:Uma2 family endonuclease